MASYNHKISDQSKVKFNPVSRELENTESALPAVTSSDEGKVLTVNSSGEWVAAEDSGIPFSTDEVKIGVLNGMSVYQKLITTPFFDRTGQITLSTGIPKSANIIDISGVYGETESNETPEFTSFYPLALSSVRLALYKPSELEDWRIRITPGSIAYYLVGTLIIKYTKNEE